MPTADEKQRQFDVLYATLCGLQQGLLDSTTKVAGFLLLATGWLATSQSAQAFLHDPFTRHLAVTSLAAAYALYACAAIMVYADSKRTLTLLVRLDSMPLEYYETRVITLPALLIFLFGNLALAALAAGLAFRAA
jgi:hypothetical protein